MAWVLDDYATKTLTRILVLGLLAVSVALLTGVAGLPTLGQTAPYLVGAYTAATLVRHDVSIGVVQLLAAAGGGGVFALVTAPLVVYARGVVVLMITLALGELTIDRRGAVEVGHQRHRRPARVRRRPPRCRGWSRWTPTGPRTSTSSPSSRCWSASCCWCCAHRPARCCGPRRDGETRMRASGHPVAGYLTVAYVAAGALAGSAGSLLVTVERYVSPGDGGFDISALVLLAVVIGGATSLIGALLGAGLVVATRDWLAGSDGGWPGTRRWCSAACSHLRLPPAPWPARKAVGT